MTIEITDELQLEATRALIRAYGANIAAVDMHSATLIVLTAALPIIEKQVREQCAAEIEAPIRELHWGDASVGLHAHVCAECRQEYPCPTIQALDGDK